jgi:DNA-binding MarR family transcriptional regulator
MLTFVPAIHRATHRIGLYLAALPEPGLSQGEAHILALLAASSPATIAELHQGLAHKRSTLTSILDRLADRGFITREVGTTDRRTFVVALTAGGRSVARRVHERLASLEARVAAQVSTTDLRGFANVIAAVEVEADALKASPSSSTTGRSRPRSRPSRHPRPNR